MKKTVYVLIVGLILNLFINKIQDKLDYCTS